MGETCLDVLDLGCPLLEGHRGEPEPLIRYLYLNALILPAYI
jgi:hypothetical protein